MIDVTNVTSTHPSLEALTSLDHNPSMVEISNAFKSDMDALFARHLDSGAVIRDELKFRIKSDLNELFQTYNSTFGNLPLSSDGYAVNAADELMFVVKRNQIDIIHRDAYIIIAEWSLGKKDLDGRWLRGPHFIGEMNLGCFKEAHPDYYKQFSELEVGQSIRLGTSRFERIQ